MTKFLNLTLVAGLMLTSITAIDAAPTKKSVATTSAKTSAEKQNTGKPTPKAWSLKTKALAALGVVATIAIAYLAYRLKANNGEVKLDDILRHEPQQAPAYQIPAGQAGRLMLNLLAHNPNFQRAMQNPASRANIEQLFQDAQFAELMNGRIAHYIGVQLQALFDDEQILHFSTEPNFGHEVINRFREILRKIEK